MVESKKKFYKDWKSLIAGRFSFDQQEGAFALCFKSTRYPGEIVATRRGSPLLIGIKSKTPLSTKHVPIFYSSGKWPSIRQTLERGLPAL
jgi:glucosamine 6-phosphate synthetase-like amidotransferase/phosphosugar isomerase protein